MKKILLRLLALIVLFVVGFVIYVNMSYEKSFSDEFPVTDLKVMADSAMIERGRYLAYGPAHCAHCHSAMDQLEAVEAGEEVAMAGGFNFPLPIGTLNTPNLTSDVETGIGGYSDGELYRMLRHNVRRDGAVCLELMPFTTMSEYDIHSIIAFLRTQPAVKNVVPPNDYNFLGKMVRTMVIRPADSDNVIDRINPDSTVAYGKYLCESVANCRGCHTNRNLQDGSFIGDPYAGGLAFGPDATTQNHTYIAPNITPDPTFGILTRYNQESFVKRMRNGRLHPYSPMPWGSFKRLSDVDLIAIYKYLNTVQPSKNEVKVTAIPPAV